MITETRLFLLEFVRKLQERLEAYVAAPPITQLNLTTVKYNCLFLNSLNTEQVQKLYNFYTLGCIQIWAYLQLHHIKAVSHEVTIMWVTGCL